MSILAIQLTSFASTTSRKKGVDEALSSAISDQLRQKTIKVVANSLNLPIKRNCFAPDPQVFIEEQYEKKICSAIVNFECQLMAFLEFIKGSKGGSLPVEKLKVFSGKISGFSKKIPISHFSTRIRWTRPLLGLVVDTFLDLFDFLKEYEKTDRSGRISYMKLRDEEFEIHEFCDSIAINKKEPLSQEQEGSDSESEPLQPLKISLIPPSPQKKRCTALSSQKTQFEPASKLEIDSSKTDTIAKRMSESIFYKQ